MKINWNSKYTTIAIYSFLVACASIVFYLIASEISSFQLKVGEVITIFMPFIIGFVMAYLFNFILEFYEDKILIHFLPKSKSKKIKRFVGLALTYITVTLLFYLFLKFVLPQLISSIMGLVNDIPNYVRDTTRMINEFNEKYVIQEEYYNILMEQLDRLRDGIVTFATNLIPVLGNTVKQVLSSLWNIVLGIIVSMYLLVDKEHFIALSKKVVKGIFTERAANKIIELAQRSDRIFGRFLSGKILDSTIIGILTFIILTIFKMPYTILISFIIAITNIIPFFGPFIGAIPSALIILFVSPIKALWFLVIIIIIQQIDGNIIGPKILGDSLGISAFWIMFSLLVFGKLFGFVGMVIGVPLFVFVYSIIKDMIESRLVKKGLPKETSDYK